MPVVNITLSRNGLLFMNGHLPGISQDFDESGFDIVVIDAFQLKTEATTFVDHLGHVEKLIVDYGQP